MASSRAFCRRPCSCPSGDAAKEKRPADRTIAGHLSISLRMFRFDARTISRSRSARRWSLPRHPPSTASRLGRTKDCCEADESRKPSNPERGELWGRSFRISGWSLGKHSSAWLRPSPARHNSPPERPFDRHQSLRAFFIRHSARRPHATLGAPPLSQTAPDPRYVLYFQTRSGTALVKAQPQAGVCSVAESPWL